MILQLFILALFIPGEVNPTSVLTKHHFSLESCAKACLEETEISCKFFKFVNITGTCFLSAQKNPDVVAPNASAAAAAHTPGSTSKPKSNDELLRELVEKYDTMEEKLNAAKDVEDSVDELAGIVEKVSKHKAKHISGLEHVTKSHAIAIEHLKTLLQALAAKTKTIDRNLASLQGFQNEVEDEIDALASGNKKLFSTEKKLLDKTDAVNKNENELTDVSEGLQKEVTKLENQTSGLATDAKAVKSVLHTQVLHEATLKKKLGNLTTGMELLASKHGKLLERVDKLGHAINKMWKERKGNTGIGHHLKQLQESFLKLQQEVLRLSSPSSQQKSAAEQDVKTFALASKVSQLKQQEEGLEGDVKQAKGEVAGVIRDLSEVTLTSQQFNTRLEAVQKATELLNTKFHELKENRKGGPNVIQMAKMEAKLLKSLSVMDTQRESLSRAVESLQDTVSDMGSRVTKQEKATSWMKDKLTTMTRTVSDNRHLLQRIQTRVSHLESKSTKTSQKLGEEDQTIGSLENSNKKTVGEIEGLQESVSNTRDQLKIIISELQEKNAISSKELLRLKTQLKAKEDQQKLTQTLGKKQRMDVLPGHVHGKIKGKVTISKPTEDIPKDKPGQGQAKSNHSGQTLLSPVKLNNMKNMNSSANKNVPVSELSKIFNIETKEGGAGNDVKNKEKDNQVEKLSEVLKSGANTKKRKGTLKNKAKSGKQKERGKHKNKSKTNLKKLTKNKGNGKLGGSAKPKLKKVKKENQKLKNRDKVMSKKKSNNGQLKVKDKKTSANQSNRKRIDSLKKKILKGKKTKSSIAKSRKSRKNLEKKQKKTKGAKNCARFKGIRYLRCKQAETKKRVARRVRRTTSPDDLDARIELEVNIKSLKITGLGDDSKVADAVKKLNDITKAPNKDPTFSIEIGEQKKKDKKESTNQEVDKETPANSDLEKTKGNIVKKLDTLSKVRKHGLKAGTRHKTTTKIPLFKQPNKVSEKAEQVMLQNDFDTPFGNDALDIEAQSAPIKQDKIILDPVGLGGKQSYEPKTYFSGETKAEDSNPTELNVGQDKTYQEPQNQNKNLRKLQTRLDEKACGRLKKQHQTCANKKPNEKRNQKKWNGRRAGRKNKRRHKTNQKQGNRRRQKRYKLLTDNTPQLLPTSVESGDRKESDGITGVYNISQNDHAKFRVKSPAPMTTGVQCPAHYLLVGRYCFRLQPSALSYKGAVAFCQLTQGTLVSVESRHKQQALQTYLKSSENLKSQVWISSTYWQPTGQLVWDSSEKPVTFNNFRGTVSTSQQCNVLNVRTGAWSASSCREPREKHFLVCQPAPAAPLKEPTSPEEPREDSTADGQSVFNPGLPGPPPVVPRKQRATSCPQSVYQLVGGQCFASPNHTMSHSQAQRYCHSIQGKLFEPFSPEKQALLQTFIQQQNYKGNEAWMAETSFFNKRWVWAGTLEKVNYTNFIGNPLKIAFQCNVFQLKTFKWKNEVCGFKRVFHYPNMRMQMVMHRAICEPFDKARFTFNLRGPTVPPKTVATAAPRTVRTRPPTTSTTTLPPTTVRTRPPTTSTTQPPTTSTRVTTLTIPSTSKSQPSRGGQEIGSGNNGSADDEEDSQGEEDDNDDLNDIGEDTEEELDDGDDEDEDYDDDDDDDEEEEEEEAEKEVASKGDNDDHTNKDVDDDEADSGDNEVEDVENEKEADKGDSEPDVGKNKGRCQAPYKESSGFCYKVFDKRASFPAADSLCRSIKGRLVSPVSREKFQSLRSFITNMKLPDKSVWISSTSDQVGQVVWDGTLNPVKFNRFDKLPEHSKQCHAMELEEYSWFSDTCSEIQAGADGSMVPVEGHRPVCEYFNPIEYRKMGEKLLKEASSRNNQQKLSPTAKVYTTLPVAQVNEVVRIDGNPENKVSHMNFTIDEISYGDEENGETAADNFQDNEEYEDYDADEEELADADEYYMQTDNMAMARLKKRDLSTDIDDIESSTDSDTSSIDQILDKILMENNDFADDADYEDDTVDDDIDVLDGTSSFDDDENDVYSEHEDVQTDDDNNTEGSDDGDGDNTIDDDVTEDHIDDEELEIDNDDDDEEEDDDEATDEDDDEEDDEMDIDESVSEDEVLDEDDDEANEDDLSIDEEQADGAFWRRRREVTKQLPPKHESSVNSTQENENHCSPPYSTSSLGDFCFYFSTSTMTFADATQYCEAYGGVIVAPSTDSKHRALLEEIRRTNKTEQLVWISSTVTMNGISLWKSSFERYNFTKLPTEPRDTMCNVVNVTSGQWISTSCRSYVRQENSIVPNRHKVACEPVMRLTTQDIYTTIFRGGMSFPRQLFLKKLLENWRFTSRPKSLFSVEALHAFPFWEQHHNRNN